MNHSDRIVFPEPPFIWPDPWVDKEICRYGDQYPFHALASTSSSALWIVTALNNSGIEVLSDCFDKNEHFKARLILAVYPTCLTTQDDLHYLQQVAERFSSRFCVRIRPYIKVTDRPTNAFCFIRNDPNVTYLMTGPSQNLGYDKDSDGKINFIFRADPVLIKSFESYFIWLWAQSRDILTGSLPKMPALVLPAGSAEAARMWKDFYSACLDISKDPDSMTETARVDPQTGEVQLVSSDGKILPSPSMEIGFPKVDYLTEKIARLYEKGMLVSIDKLSLIPPLDTPLDPAWFGDSAEVQHGIITRKLSMRVTIIDEKTLNEIDKYRKKMRELLNRFSFRLADNMRWIPYKAKELFENEIERINEDGQKLIKSLLKGDSNSFVQERKPFLIKSINDMYREVGKKGKVADEVIEKVVNSLTARITKSQSANFMPKLTYSNVVFSNTTNTWVTPWGQAFALLSDIAAFHRKALSDPFFYRGLRVSEDELIDAMNVADDAVVRDMAKCWPNELKERCKLEISFLKQLGESFIDPRFKCDLVYKLISGETLETLYIILNEAEKEKERDQKSE